MGISLNLYRASIGLFGGGTKKRLSFLFPKHMMHERFGAHFMHGRKQWSELLVNEKCNRAMKSRMLCKTILALTVILQLLMLCGDIENNPGPTDDNVSCDISICHANIRSLKHIDPDTGNFDRLTHIKCHLVGSYDIITLSETWLTSSDSSDNFRLMGYQAPFRRDRYYGAVGYGGVLAWISNSIACKRRTDLEQLEMEAMWLECRSNNNKFFLCVAYRTASNSDGTFWDKLQESVNTILEVGGGKILIAGDLNSHPGTPEGNKLYEFAAVNEFTVHIN